MANDTSLTPMMEQYFRIKELHPDALLFFRLGDFYEMFYEDARTAAPVLEIALTSRQKVPMCGVPYHAVSAYLPKLLRQGFKVAICEQVEDPKAAKGVVKREVIKVLTPGTAVEIETEEAKESTYIVSLALEDEGWGLALLDLVAGEVRALEGSWPEVRVLADELFRSAPKEILYPEGAEEALKRVLAQAGLDGPALSPAEGWLFDPPEAARVVLGHFGARSLSGFGLEDRTRAVAAAGALIAYVRKVRRDSLALVGRISYIHSGDHLRPRRDDRPQPRARPQPPRRPGQGHPARRHRLHRDRPGRAPAPLLAAAAALRSRGRSSRARTPSPRPSARPSPGASCARS